MKKVIKENIVPFIFAIITSVIMMKTSSRSSMILTLLTIPLYFLIYRKVIPKLLKYEIEKKDVFNKKELITYGLIIFIILLVYVLAYYPGYGTFDTVFQWEQILANKYNDWHPILSTLIFFKLPSLVYQSYISCTIFQIMYIGAILVYFAFFLRKNGINKLLTITILLLFLLNPHIAKTTVTLWKDVPFSFAILLCTLFLINIYQSKGEWIKKRGNLILFIITIIGITFLRHNGIACSLVLLLVLAFIYKREKLKYLSIILGILLIKFLVFPIAFNIFNIGTHDSNFSEMMGVPLNQISYIYNNGGVIKGTEHEIISKIAPLEDFKTYYDPCSFNEIKWNGKFDANYVNENKKEVLSLWLSLISRNKAAAIKSYINVTSPIWRHNVYDSNADLISGESDNIFKKIIAEYNRDVIENGISIIFLSYGTSLLVMLFAITKIITSKKDIIKRLIPYILVVVNTGVIMLLITGRETRFVFSNIICAYPLLIFPFLKCNNESSNKLTSKNNTLIEFLKYFIVGVIAAIVNIGAFTIFTDKLSINYIISNIIAFTLGLITNYLLSKKYVFKEDSMNPKIEFIIYGIIGVVGLAIDTLVIGLLKSTGLINLISKIISTMIVFIWNFGARKIMYLIIKRSKK